MLSWQILMTGTHSYFYWIVQNTWNILTSYNLGSSRNQLPGVLQWTWPLDTRIPGKTSGPPSLRKVPKSMINNWWKVGRAYLVQTHFRKVQLNPHISLYFLSELSSECYGWPQTNTTNTRALSSPSLILPHQTNASLLHSVTFFIFVNF